MAASAFNCRTLCVNCTQSVRQLECALTHTLTYMQLNICMCAYPGSTLKQSPTKAAVLTYRTFWLLSLSAFGFCTILSTVWKMTTLISSFICAIRARAERASDHILN